MQQESVRTSPSTTDHVTGVDDVPPFARRPVLALAAAYCLVLAAGSARYPYNGDELYFISAGRHLSWGYVDQPGLTALVARLMDSVFRDSLVGLRLPVTLLVPVGVIVAAAIAREFGGARRAQVLAGTTYAIAPLVLSNSHHLLNNTIDFCLWTAIGWLLVRWIRTRDDRLWLAIGVLTALSVQTKYLIGVFWAATLLLLLITAPRDLVRDLLRSRMFWIGGALAAASTVPGLLWQADNGWPQLDKGPSISQFVAETYGTPRLIFLPSVVAAIGLLGVALLCSGVWRLLSDPAHRPYRFLAWTLLLLTAVVWIGNLRRDYVAGMFPIFWGAAAVAVEQGRTASWWGWIPTPVTIAVSVLVVLRGFVPLPVEWIAPVDRRVLVLQELDWEGLTEEVAAAYRDVPEPERSRTVVVAADYWRSAALDRFGPDHDLPRDAVYGDMRGHWFFRQPPDDVTTIVYVGPLPTELRRACGSVERVATFVDADASPIPSPVPPTPIHRCSDVTAPMADLWPELFHMGLRPTE